MGLSEDQILQDLNTKLKTYVSQQKALEALIERTKAAIDLYSVQAPELFTIGNTNNTPFTYNADLTWKERIIECLKYKNRVLTTKQIADLINIAEPNKYSEDQLRSHLAGNLNQLIKSRGIIAYKPSNIKMKGQYYGNPNWFDINGDILERYKPEPANAADLWG